MKKNKIIISALAALAGGGILLALYKRKKDKEEEEGSGKTVTVQPPYGGDDEEILDGGGDEDEGSGDGGSGGGGGGGGGGANMTLCRGLNDEGEEVAELVNIGEACPENAPFSDDVVWDEYLYDAFHCYDVDEEGEITEQDIEFDEVCGEDYPEYPFETQNDALLYASDPSFYEGCTDETAFNFDENAILDDGSCEIVVEGCMIEAADNYDAEANTENNDSCEFPPEAVLGCTDDSANNFDENADTEDGSCLYDVECYFFTDMPYTVSSTTFELLEGQSCEADVAPTYLDLNYSDGDNNASVVEDFLMSGYYNSQENAQAVLDGFANEAGATEGNTTCFYINPDTDEIETSEFSLAGASDCASYINSPFELFNTFEDAQQFLEEIAQLNTQECYTYDENGVYIISDIPVMDSNTGDIISCEDAGYYTYEITAQGNYNEEYPPDPSEDYEEDEEIIGCTDPDAQNYDATATTEGGYDGLCEYLGGGAPDTSAIVTPACGDVNLCLTSGLVDGSANINNVLYMFASAEATANEINNALGFECFDPDTCEIVYEPPAPVVGEIESYAQSQELLIACFPPDPTTGAMNSELMYYFTQLNVQEYPMMWDEFNALIGFECLDANAQVATPYEEPPEGFEDTIVDDSDDYTEPIVDIEGEGTTESDPEEEPEEESEDEFDNFVNSLNNSPASGCTDPMAQNYNEGAETDDGSCDY